MWIYVLVLCINSAIDIEVNIIIIFTIICVYAWSNLFFAHCSLLFLCKTAVFSFSKWSLYLMMKHVVSPLLMGICVWNEFLLLAKPPWMLRSLLNVFIFYFRNDTKMVIWIYLVSYLKISYKCWWVYNEYFTFIYFM